MVKMPSLNRVKNLCAEVLADELFGFLQVAIQVSNELLEKFNEFSPLFVIDSMSED